MGMAYMGKGNYEEAESCLRSALRVNPGGLNLWTRRLLVEAFVAQGKYKAALEVSVALNRDSEGQTCRFHDPRDIYAEIVHDLAWLYEQHGDVEKSIFNYRRASVMYKTVCVDGWKFMEECETVWEFYGRYMCNLGLIYEKLGNWENVSFVVRKGPLDIRDCS